VRRAHATLAMKTRDRRTPLTRVRLGFRPPDPPEDTGQRLGDLVDLSARENDQRRGQRDDVSDHENEQALLERGEEGGEGRRVASPGMASSSIGAHHKTRAMSVACDLLKAG
jgi:hypothetical protein